MNPDKLNALTQFLFALGTVVGPICAVLLARINRGKKSEPEAMAQPERESPIVRAGPVILLATAGAAWLYLCSQSPQIARLVLPPFEPAAMATAAPGRDLCHKNVECGLGRWCDKGRCRETARRLDGPYQPRVAEPGALGDFPATPWMAVAVSPPWR